jgi:transketolase
MEKKEKLELERFAAQIRLETLKEIKHRGFGHIGGAMSIVEALAVLYGKVMRYDPQNPKWPDRDYLVCSKGHAGPSIYAALALKGFFPMDKLLTLNQNGTDLPSHCDRNKTPGIDMTTGSLGQGFSLALGVALGNRIDKRDNFTYLFVGDGELNEGQCWEAVMFAAHNRIDNLVCFVDDNKKQLDGYTKDINEPFDFTEKFRAFGWNSRKVDGGSVGAIYDAVIEAKKNKGKPNCIILDTVKGQGIPFVEKEFLNHHMRFGPAEMEESDKMITELENKIKDFERLINEED